MNVRADSAHHVMHNGPHRDEFSYWIDVLILKAQLTDKWELRVDHAFAKVSQIQMNNGAVRGVDRSSFLLLMHKCLREPIARPEFHRTQDRLRLWLAQVVILHIAVAILIN